MTATIRQKKTTRITLGILAIVLMIASNFGVQKIPAAGMASVCHADSRLLGTPTCSA